MNKILMNRKPKGFCLASAFGLACWMVAFGALCIGAWKVAGILFILGLIGWGLYFADGRL